MIACGGIVVLVPFTVWEALAWLPSTLSWKSVALVLAAALIPGAGAYAAYSFMQRVLGAARVAMVLYLGPLYSAVIGWLVLGERIEWFHAGRRAADPAGDLVVDAKVGAGTARSARTTPSSVSWTRTYR